MITYEFKFDSNIPELTTQLKEGLVEALRESGDHIQSIAKRSIKTTRRSVQNVREIGGRRVRTRGRAGSARVVKGRKYGGDSEVGKPHNTRKGRSRRAVGFALRKSKLDVHIGYRGSQFDFGRAHEFGGFFPTPNHNGEIIMNKYPKRPVMATALTAAITKGERIKQNFSSIL